jgi:hypothetical protein
MMQSVKKTTGSRGAVAGCDYVLNRRKGDGKLTHLQNKNVNSVLQMFTNAE